MYLVIDLLYDHGSNDILININLIYSIQYTSVVKVF